MRSREFEVFFGGSRGPGKTASLVAYMLMYVNNSNYKGLLIRRTFPQMLEIKDRTKRLYKKIDPGARYNSEDNRWEFSSGATIQLGHCQHEDDKERYQGQEYQIIGFDELTHFTESQYNAIKLSCRSGDSEMIPMVRATGNPGSIGHGWVKRRFIDIGPPGTPFEEKLPNGKSLIRKFIAGTVYDNPTLIANDPQYVAILEGIQDPKLKAMMLYGDWNAGEGLKFSNFSIEKHVRKLNQVFTGTGRPPEGYPVFASVDWGYSRPFAIYWHTMDQYDKIITFREWYGIKTDPMTGNWQDNTGIRMSATEVAHGFVQRSADLDVQFMVGDPHMWDKVGASQGSIGEEFELILAQSGIPMRRGNNNRVGGWMQMHSRLTNAPDGIPWWLITDNCRHLIRTIQSAPEDPNNMDDVDTKYEDHALDSVRYFLMAFPLQLETSMANLRGRVIELDEYRRNLIGHNNHSDVPNAFSYH